MYRKGNTYMISQAQAKLFCKYDISLIKNYDIAVNDKTNKANSSIYKRWKVHQGMDGSKRSRKSS